MNDTNENKAAPPVDVPRLVRQVVVERVTTKREEIPVEACLPHEAFEKAKNAGKVLTESETVEYIIKDYPEELVDQYEVAAGTLIFHIMCDINKPWLNDPRKTELENQMDAGTYVPTPESERVTRAEREMMERDSSFNSERQSGGTP